MFYSIFGGLSAATPDFAFPKKVIATSREELKHALDRGDGDAVISSLLAIEVATSMQDTDSVPGVLALIDEAAGKAKPVDAALIKLLKASVLSAAYNNERYIYDRRSLPPLPLDKDYRLWSGAQMRNVIDSLVTDAVNAPGELAAVKITSYPRAIDCPRRSVAYYPTLLDFACAVGGRLTDDNTLRQHLTELVATHSAEGSAPALMARIALLKENGNRYNTAGLNDSIYDLYRPYSHSRYGWLALQALDTPMPGSSPREEVTAYLDTLNTYLRRFPSCDGAGALRSSVNDIMEPQIHLSATTAVVPGGVLKIAVDGRNTSRFTIFLVPCREINGRPANYFDAKHPPLTPAVTRSFSITRVTGAVTRDTVEITAPAKPGRYLLVPSINGTLPKSGWYNHIDVTSLSLEAATFGQKNWAYVVDPLTGACAAEGTDLIVKKLDDKSGRDAATVTIKAEPVTILPQGNLEVTARKGNMASDALRLYNYRSNPEGRLRVSVLTDRPLYHPGEEIMWCVIAQRADSAMAAVIPDEELKVTLYDVNSQIVDTATVVTDSFGRADGVFTTSKDGLTGRFRISVKGADDLSAWQSIEISDYRLPTFEVTIPTVTRDMPEKGGATLEGVARTYSGVPVAGAKVAVEICRTTFFRFGGRGEQTAAYETVTDADGRFTVEIPASRLPAPDSYGGNAWVATATVTSPGGETATADRRFTLGRPYALSLSIARDVNADRPCRLKVSMTDINGAESSSPVDITLYDADSAACLKRRVIPGIVELDLSALPSGRYSLTGVSADPDLSEPAEVETVWLYRPTDPLPPVTDTPLWMPERRLTADAAGHASLLLGSRGELHIVMVAQAGDSVVANRWISYAPGIHILPLDIPDGEESMSVELLTTRDYKFQRETVTVTRGKPRQPLTIVAETFRNKLLTGENETWRFRVVGPAGDGERAAMVFDMYNRAIEAIAPSDFRFMPLTPDRIALTTAGNYFGEGWWSDHISKRSPSWRSIAVPDWVTWGYPLYSRHRVYSTSLRRSRNLSMKKMAGATDDCVEEEEVVMEAAADFGTAAPAMATGATLAENKIEFAADQAVTTDGAEEAAAEDGADDNISVRPAEVALAFFRPMLTTEADGSLVFSFTAPQANSEWVLRALAYTTDLRSDMLEETVVTSKPVMVSANPPRFLYAGDRAEVTATVMNTLDSAVTVSTVIEIFDPVTERILATHTSDDTLDGHASKTVTISVDAPLEGALLGYRVRSRSGSFSDGEQHIMPLLQPSAPVIDAYPFYASPGQKEITVKLPEINGDASVTLQYCDNPSWYVATALPGLRTTEISTAPQAAASVFSAAVAEGILKARPAIAEALKEWQASPTDTTLRSLLERDPDLKLMLLNATPWVADAMSQTARMERLALLFDTTSTEECYSKAISVLSSLSAPEGGWRWSECSDIVSDWSTRRVLHTIGRLRQLDMMPDLDGLDTMVSAALDAIDRRISERQEHTPDLVDPGYLTITDCFGDRKLPTRCRRVIDNTLRHYRRDWRHMNPQGKAEAALALLRHGDLVTADTIVASLRDFATTSAEKGMWWPATDTGYAAAYDGAVSATARVLEAIAAVSPTSPDIDLIRQWLILQKEALDWGDSNSTTDAIAAILTTGTEWTAAEEAASFRLGRHKLTPGDIESRLGYFRMDLSAADASKSTLKVKRSAPSPAWGALYVKQRLDLTDIQAAAVPDLSIEKELFRRVTVDNGKFQQESADTLHVGDVVQVNLTIRAGRDIDYVTVTDLRGACLVPAEQLSGTVESDGVVFYRENRDTSTNLFIDRLPRGIYRLSYTLYVNNAGCFTSGAATIQSAYAPALTARSSAPRLTVKPSTK